jgi:hypothetical protein
MTNSLNVADASGRTALSRWDGEGGAIDPVSNAERAPPPQSVDGARVPPLMLAVDSTAHSRDGLVLHSLEGAPEITAFIGRRVMDEWVAGERRANVGPSLFREEYNRLGAGNLRAIGRIVRAKYGDGTGFDAQHPFVDILLADIAASGEWLDLGDLWRDR